jgi:hypothetical protein
MGLPAIELSHILWVLMWALVGFGIGAAAWSQFSVPSYKDWIAGTIGISVEALGVELLKGGVALVVPLGIGLVMALILRLLPKDASDLHIETKWIYLKGFKAFQVFWVMFFIINTVVLLLSYRGWWEALVSFPGG